MVQHSLSLRTILLIEPDQNLARIIERALQDYGFVVTQAAAGSEALEILDAQYPDAVVLWTLTFPMALGPLSWTVFVS